MDEPGPKQKRVARGDQQARRLAKYNLVGLGTTEPHTPQLPTPDFETQSFVFRVAMPTMP